jgi:hypothetical protein
VIASALDRPLAFDAYTAALDREEDAVQLYARLMKRVGHLVETGLDYPVGPEVRSGLRT